VADRLTFLSFPAIFLASVLTFLSFGLPSRVDSASPARPLIPDSAIVEKVERERLERVVRELSGADTIHVDGEPVTITTRHALAQETALARSYLLDEVRNAGYEPVVQPFVLTVLRPNLTATAVSRGLDTLWIAGTNGRVLRSTAADGWSGFSPCGSIVGMVYDLEVDGSGMLWAACGYTDSPYGGLYVSTDGGSTWSVRFSSRSIQTLASVTLRAERTGMASGAAGTVISTTNGGISWRQYPPELVGYESLYQSASNGPMHFWFISDIGSLWETDDLGTNWVKRLPAWTPIAGIDFHGQSCGIIVGNGIVYYTRDGGRAWNPVSIPTAFQEVSMMDTLRAVASGGGGEIWITEDGGASWARFGSECDVAADVLGAAYAGNGWFSLVGRDLERLIYWGESYRSCTAYEFADTLWGNNISFRHEGGAARDTLVLLTAHYDSYGGGIPSSCAPGADDNASGVSAVLECARALRGERTRKSVEFVLFDGEELGLKGSRHYASHLDTGAVYETVLNLDMLGYNPMNAMTAVVSMRSGVPADSAIVSTIEAAIDSFGLGLTLDVVDYSESGSSDQLSFWENGIPGVLIIERRRGELNPNYHKCSDIADALDYAYLETCAKTALGTVALLAGLQPAMPVPRHLALYQNHPNPFSSETNGSFALPSASFVELAVYDVSGRRVAVIDRGERGAGESPYRWDGRDSSGGLLASGVYFLRLSSSTGEAVKKIVILR